MKKHAFIILVVASLALMACGKSKDTAEDIKDEVVTEAPADGAEDAGDAEADAADKDAAGAPEDQAETQDGEAVDATSAATVKGGSLSPERMAVLESLYANQLNFSNGIAQTNLIPVADVEELYNHYDDIEGTAIEEAPILLREYAETNEVYFDYATDFSIKWEKDTGNITIEPTDTAEREEFRQKAHK